MTTNQESAQEFVCADNLEYIKTLDDKSVDLIYFNPPFGITAAKYDTPLNWGGLWPEMWRVLKPNRNIVIHCSQPFTFDLISTQRKYFKYCWYWNKKGRPTNHLNAKKQPLRLMEEICVFYKKLELYNPQMILREKEYVKKKSKNGSHYYQSQKETLPERTFTHRYPTHLIEMPRRTHNYSTRPVSLCEYFIKTYSNEGETVLDLTCSDGQSGVACRNINRHYLGIDIDPKMIEDAENNYSSSSSVIP